MGRGGLRGERFPESFRELSATPERPPPGEGRTRKSGTNSDPTFMSSRPPPSVPPASDADPHRQRGPDPHGQRSQNGQSEPSAHQEAAETQVVRVWQRLSAAGMRALSRAEVAVDQARWGLRRRYGTLGPLLLVNYCGYGTRTQATLRGRVLEAVEFPPWLPEDRGFANFRHMWRRFNSNELPGAEVRATWGSSTVTGVTDDEGYFELSLALPEVEPIAGSPASATNEPTCPHAASGGDWHEAEVEVIAAPLRGFLPVRARTEILIPNAAADFGVISDVDDTVLQSYVTRKLRMLRATLFGSPFTRQPFAGTTEFFAALVAGLSGEARNPVFYVSKSPWNLYGFLNAFLERQGLPRGPLLLRDIGLHEKPSLDSKTQSIERLLTTYAKLRFVLIGDSGEHDADIYLSVAGRWPGRILGIYIRNLGVSEATRQRVLGEAAQLGTSFTFVSHAREALEHARAAGLAAATEPLDLETQSRMGGTKSARTAE